MSSSTTKKPLIELLRRIHAKDAGWVQTFISQQQQQQQQQDHDHRMMLLSSSASDGRFPIHEAVSSGSLDIVRLLLSVSPASANAVKLGNNWTPLMLAASHGYRDILAFLLESGATASFANKDGWTAFHIACREGRLDICEDLYRHFPAAVGLASKNGRLPVHIAALHSRVDIVLLLTRCAEYRSLVPDRCGMNELMFSAQSSSPLCFAAALFGSAGLADAARAVASAVGGESAAVPDALLAECTSTLNADTRRLLVQHLLLTDVLGNTCAHFCAQTNSVDTLCLILRLLSRLDREAPQSATHTPAATCLNGRNSRGETPAHIAAKHGHLDMLAELARNPAVDWAVNDENGRTPVGLAGVCRQVAALELLERHGIRG